MIEGIKPLNVSPFIKTARWSLFFLGIIYGSQRKYSLELYEMKASVIRNAQIAEARRLRMTLNRNSSIKCVEDLFEGLNITDLPPDWRDSI